MPDFLSLLASPDTWPAFMHPWPNRIVLFFLFSLSIFFIFKFFIPAFKIRNKLKNAIAQIETIKADGGDSPTIDIDAIAQQAMKSKDMQHLWSEYTETLHPQHCVDEMGQERVACWRATATADTFFTEQVLVDTPLKTEFFKHLPGIFTGLGIIGTFSGLIRGLSQFNASVDPDAVRKCLEALIRDVGDAFWISATAIGLAIFFTWVEKSWVTYLYRQVEDLHQKIDGLFNAGAGEEYLSRIVTASETSATQAKHLKDALVNDFREILNEITNRQVEASAQHTREMSQGLAKVFSDSIRSPMDRISEAVGKVGANQGDAVNTMLTDVLSHFSAKMEEMFGGQLQGMAGLLTQTNNAMVETVAKFDQLAVNLQNAGQGAADAMAERLREAIVAMEVRQGDMTYQMSQFVEQMQLISKASQTESSRQLHDIMNEVGGIMTVIKKTTEEIQQNTAQANQEAMNLMGRQVQAALASLQEQTRHTEESSLKQQAQWTEQSSQLLSELAAQVETLGRRVNEAAETMNNSSTMVASTAKSAIERMNSGADSLLLATSELSDTEKRVASTMHSMTQVTQGLQTSATSLSTASGGVQRAFENYQTTTGVFASMVENLKTTVDTAKHEASISAELVTTLNAAADKLSDAQLEAEHYLEGVTRVLGEAHQSFADNVERTMQQHNAAFHQELSTAITYLKSGIQELGDTLDTRAMRQ